MNKANLPDVALENLNQNTHVLDMVGMAKIELPLKLISGQKQLQTNTLVEAGVNLTEAVKGIHMSRIYKTITQKLTDENFSFSLLKFILEQMLETHKGMSDFAKVKLNFNYQRLTNSLLSDNQGWRTYPIELIATLNFSSEFNIELCPTITYSSTCPCSAALSRQLIQIKFQNDFKNNKNINPEDMIKWLGDENNICATPHSQRSYAMVKMTLVDPETLGNDFLDNCIDGIENALKTNVQATVKREDEQEFARLNAANLMFGEDSARRLKSWIVNDFKQHIKAYSVRVEHHESLHEHDAIAEFNG